MLEWGLLSKSFPEVTESEDEDEVMLSDIQKESAKVVKGEKTTEEVEDSNLVIEEKVEALKQ